MPRYVEYGFSGFGEIVNETPRTSRRPAGYDIRPLNAGTGDSFGGYAVWCPVAQVRDADMTRWTYDAARNLWRKAHAEAA